MVLPPAMTAPSPQDTSGGGGGGDGCVRAAGDVGPPGPPSPAAMSPMPSVAGAQASSAGADIASTSSLITPPRVSGLADPGSGRATARLLQGILGGVVVAQPPFGLGEGGQHGRAILGAVDRAQQVHARLVV